MDILRTDSKCGKCCLRELLTAQRGSPNVGDLSASDCSTDNCLVLCMHGIPMRIPRCVYVWISGAASAVLAGLACHLLYKGPRRKRAAAEPLRVLITGAAGQIGYALAPAIASGQMFGPDQKVVLQLYDIPAAANYLEGLRLELQDGLFPLLAGVVTTTTLATACEGVAVAVLLAGAVRRPNSSRAEQLQANMDIYLPAAAALQQHAHPGVKVLVVASPANANAAMLLSAGQGLDPSCVTALTRLDHNRAVSQLSKKLGVSPSSIANVVVWGSSSQHQLLPYATSALVDGAPLQQLLDEEEVEDYLQQEWVAAVQQRGRIIHELRQLSPALSAVRAICDHMRDWLTGTPGDTWVSMGVSSDGSYGIPRGLVCSLPCRCRGGRWSIVPGLPLDPASWVVLSSLVEELWEEQALAAALGAERSKGVAGQQGRSLPAAALAAGLPTAAAAVASPPAAAAAEDALAEAAAAGGGGAQLPGAGDAAAGAASEAGAAAAAGHSSSGSTDGDSPSDGS